MKKQEIKAVEMVRRIREAQYEEIKGKSHEEIMAYFRKRAESVTRGLGPVERGKRSA